MFAAIDMQQHAGQRSSFSPPPMRRTPPALLHQTSANQRLVKPGVADLELMLLAELLMEVPHIEILVWLAIQPEHFFHGLQRHSVTGGFALAPVRHSGIAFLFEALAPAPHCPITNAYDLGRRPPRDLLRHRL